MMFEIYKYSIKLSAMKEDNGDLNSQLEQLLLLEGQKQQRAIEQMSGQLSMQEQLARGLQQQEIEAHQKEILERLENFKNRLGQEFRQFKPNSLNIFQIQSPIWHEIKMVLECWNQRKRSEGFFLTLRLLNCHFPKETLKMMFKPYVSIKLEINEQVIQNEGILCQEGDYFYEGTPEFMRVESNELLYKGSTVNLKFHGNGMLFSKSKKNGFSYQGAFENGKRHGLGQYIDKNSIYSGEFKNDYKDGQGLEVILKKRKKGDDNRRKIKSIYSGPFKAGQKDGEEGIQITFKGDKFVEEIQQYKEKDIQEVEKDEKVPHTLYIGEWCEGARHRFGQMKYQNNDTYKGNWEKGQFHGQGQYVQFQNCIYTGEFKNGKYDGNGKIEYKNGDTYEGEFQSGKKHGRGKYDYADGDYYDGEWKNDSADGEGESMFGSDFFVGTFKNGKKHGEGQLTDEEGNIKKGIWENNQLIKILELNGEPYEEQLDQN